MVELRNLIGSVQSSNQPQSKTMTLAADYPDRIIAINPHTPIGSLSTIDTTDPNTNLTISNATAIHEDVRDWFDGSQITFPTGFLEFQPNYNEYRDAPTTAIENSVVYNQFTGGEQLSATDQRLIQGNRIVLGSLTGDREFTDREADLELTPESSGMTRVPVQATGEDQPIEIQIPTRLSEDRWDELLEGEQTVESYQVQNGVLFVELDESRTYELQMARVSLGPNPQNEGPHYLKRHSGDGQAISRGQQTTLSTQVRDRYNNPVSGVEVDYSIVEGSGNLVPDEPVVTDENGIAEATFVASDDNETVEINATTEEIDDSTGPSYEDRREVDFSVDVGSFDPSGAGNLNPGDSVILKSSTINDGDDTSTLEFEPVGNESLHFSEARFNLFLSVGSGGSTIAANTIEEINVNNQDYVNDPLQKGESLKEIDSIEINPNGTTLDIQFDEFKATGEGGWVMYTITFVIEETGEFVQYLVADD
ncbi:MAG: Ig-like domain-containing protein [Halodesulfurarchaeum sp.]